jgi:hypothetical protein
MTSFQHDVCTNSTRELVVNFDEAVSSHPRCGVQGARLTCTLVTVLPKVPWNHAELGDLVLRRLAWNITTPYRDSELLEIRERKCNVD